MNSKIIGITVISVSSLVLGAFLTLPLFSKADSNGTIYVDDSAATGGNGSSNTPYQTVDKGLEEADGGDTVYVKEGTYTENIIIPKNVKLEGDGTKENIIITASSNNQPTVQMRNGSSVKHITVVKGKTGIEVKKKSEATIKSCIIKESKNHGIRIKGGNIGVDYEVTISNNTIEDNKGSGIYVKKEQRGVIEDNDILNNKKDGIYLQGTVEIDVNDNKIKYNNRSGMDVMLDDSDLEIKDNTFKDNGKSGIEVHAKNGDGNIFIEDSKFMKNDEYGIRRVQHGGADEKIWDSLDLRSGNTFSKNKKAKISSIKIKN